MLMLSIFYLVYEITKIIKRWQYLFPNSCDFVLCFYKSCNMDLWCFVLWYIENVIDQHWHYLRGFLNWGFPQIIVTKCIEDRLYDVTYWTLGWNTKTRSWYSIESLHFYFDSELNASFNIWRHIYKEHRCKSFSSILHKNNPYFLRSP